MKSHDHWLSSYFMEVTVLNDVSDGSAHAYMRKLLFCSTMRRNTSHPKEQKGWYWEWYWCLWVWQSFAPNVISHVQFLDQGVIRSVKQCYRNYLYNWSLQETHRWEGDVDLSKHMPYTRVILPWLQRAWDDLRNAVFWNCNHRSDVRPSPYRFQSNQKTMMMIDFELRY